MTKKTADTKNSVKDTVRATEALPKEEPLTSGNESAADMPPLGSKVCHIFEFGDKKVSTRDVEESILDICRAEGKMPENIGTIDIYYNLAERRAYYVINGESEGKYVSI